MAEYTEPVVKHCQLRQAHHPGLPLFLLGHSMGGLVVVLASLAQPELAAGLVLVSPLIGPDPAIGSPINNILAKVISSSWTLVSIINC